MSKTLDKILEKLPVQVEATVELACSYIALSTQKPFPVEATMQVQDLTMFIKTGGPLVYSGFMGFLLAAQNPECRPLLLEAYENEESEYTKALLEERIKGFDLYIINHRN